MKYISTYLFPLLAALCSCVREESFVIAPGAEGRIAFEATVAPVPATRGEVRTIASDGAGDQEAFLRPMSPDVCAPETKGSPVTDLYDTFSFRTDTGLQGTASTKDGQLYQVDGLQYFALPKDEGNRFLCWAPADADGVAVQDGGSIHYQASSDIRLQPDLLVAVSPEVGRLDKGPTPLTFRHALAGLEIKAGTVFPGCTVRSVRLSGVVTEGEYDPWTDSWSVSGETSDLVLADRQQAAAAESVLAGGECTAMLVPQTFPADATLTVDLTYDSRNFTYTVPLEGLTLRSGNILTLGVGCRSMYLFEGTASGDFSVYYYKGVASGTTIYKICDVPVEEDGTFSVIVPALSTANQRHSYSFARNARLLTVTRLPDILATRTSFQRMFQGCTGLVGIYCDIPSERVTTWSWAFYNCQSLRDLPASLDTRSCTVFNSMFYGCRRLTAIPALDTASGTDFSNMFTGCASLPEAPAYTFPKGTHFSGMFRGCSSLKTLPAYSFPKGTNFSGIFSDCTSLQSVPLLGTSEGTDFSAAFSGCTSLTDIAPIDTGKGRNFQQMFSGCTRLRSIPFLDTARGTNFREMFYGCSVLTGIPLLDTAQGTTFYLMFAGCKALTACPQLDTSSGTNFHGMFDGCTALTGTWPYQTSKGTNFELMFSGCSRLVHVDEFDVSSGTIFNHMFYGCAALQDIPAFQFTKSCSNAHMFDGCSSLTAVPDWNWSVMTSCFHMFSGCSSLTEITTPVSTSSCTNFTQMFKDCTSLRRVAALDVSRMTAGSLLFQGCSSLVEAPELSAPDATEISQMFDGCTSLALVRGISFPKAGSWYAFFRDCRSLVTLPEIDYSAATSLSNCFQCLYGRGSLETLPAIDASSLTAATEVLWGQQKLKDFGGFTGIRISFSVDTCTSLTRESLLNIIAGLAEVSEARTLTLGSENKAKLTAEEIQVALDKGWTVL
ncbi:MAG: BspA family leucine-rich repeat surface protein [Bacteroidales bacterium]|nr:BspA family leucine-rich repeat surface protein [Bacteroidales bacterium]